MDTSERNTSPIMRNYSRRDVQFENSSVAPDLPPFLPFPSRPAIWLPTGVWLYLANKKQPEQV